MSTNNQVVIRKNKSGYFEVHENICVDNPFKASKSSLIATEKTLEKAYKSALSYCNVYPYVEYGIHLDVSCWRKNG